MTNQRGSIVVILLAILALLAIGGGAYYEMQQKAAVQVPAMQQNVTSNATSTSQTQVLIATSSQLYIDPTNQNQFSASPMSGAAPLRVSFSADTEDYSGGTYAIDVSDQMIDFGDGTNGSFQNAGENTCARHASSAEGAYGANGCIGEVQLAASHIYQQAGTYTVTYYTDLANGAGSCPSGVQCNHLVKKVFDTVTITVTSHSNATTISVPGMSEYTDSDALPTFTVSPTSGKAPLIVTATPVFAGISEDAQYMDFGDGTTVPITCAEAKSGTDGCDQMQSVSHTYTKAGIYQVYQQPTIMPAVTISVQ